MVPLSRSIQNALAYTRTDGTFVYTGRISSEWTIGVVPHGGYMAALLLDAAVQHQSERSLLRQRPHPDPAHLTVQFLTPSSSNAAYELELNVISATSRWTRLDITLKQGALLRIRAHCLFTNLPVLEPGLAPSKTNMTVMPSSDSPFAPITPFTLHPSQAVPMKIPRVFNFGDELIMAHAPDNDEVRKSTSIEWKGWVELKDETEDIRREASLLGFFGDLFFSGIDRLPFELPPSWLPTLHLAIDFKAKLPLVEPRDVTKRTAFAPRTIGVSSKVDFLHEGRYSVAVELWSAPCEIGGPVAAGGDQWRKESQILAVATQVALMVPFAVNARNKL